MLLEEKLYGYRQEEYLSDLEKYFSSSRWNYRDRCILEASDGGYGVDSCR